MENEPQIQQQTQEDAQLARSYKLQIWKERIYLFFYNIWPAVNRTLTGFVYLMFRIIRGFFRSAMESLKGGG